MIEAPRFFRTATGGVWVEHWPEHIEVTDEFLTNGDPERIRREGDTLTFLVDNGSADYRITRLPNPYGRFYGHRERWSIDGQGNGT